MGVGNVMYILYIIIAPRKPNNFWLHSYQVPDPNRYARNPNVYMKNAGSGLLPCTW